MCSSPKIPPPATPNPVVAPPETVAGTGGTIKSDFSFNPKTGKPEARRKGVRGLRLPAYTPIQTEQDNV